MQYSSGDMNSGSILPPESRPPSLVAARPLSVRPSLPLSRPRTDQTPPAKEAASSPSENPLSLAPAAAAASMATPLPDPRKRALDALDRRFALAKAPPHPTSTSSPRNNPTSTPSQPASSLKAKPALLSSASETKGNDSQSIDGENAIYSEMSEALHENLLRGVTTDADKKDVVENILIDIMRKGDESSGAVSGAKKLKKENWVLLDNFIPKNDNSLADARAKSLKSHSKRSRNHMSMKQHRQCGSFDFPKEFHNFELFKPMHAMWKEYICELVKDTGKKLLADRLLTADLHGAFLIVVESTVVSYVGVRGIMVRETTETFGIVSENDKFRVVPKAGSVFMLQADSWAVTLCGDMLSAKERLKVSLAQTHLQPLLR